MTILKGTLIFMLILAPENIGKQKERVTVFYLPREELMRMFKSMFLVIIFVLFSESQVIAQGNIPSNIMDESSILGRALVCRQNFDPGASDIGKELGEDYANYYKSRYPGSENELFSAIIPGLNLGAAYQSKQGDNGCNEVYSEANKIMKKVGSHVRF